MSSIDLSGFELTSTPDLQPPSNDSEWLPAVVPGGVHESLLASGRIDHPYLNENETSVRWVDETTWWYRTNFAGPGDLDSDERLRLVLNGLDTVATVWLNGRELGSQANQYRPAVFDITSVVQGENELQIRFSSPLANLSAPAVTAAAVDGFSERRNEIAPAQVAEAAEPVPVPELARTLRRKMSCSWGWDFGPRLPSMGLLQGAELWRDRIAVIAGRHIRTDGLNVEARTATLHIAVDLDSFRGTADLIRLSVTSPDERTLQVDQAAADQVTFDVPLEDVQLWWTHDLGGQPLYTVDIELLAGGEVIDATSDRVGLREIRLDRSPDDEGGNLFRFILNGVPIFARGANWLPVSLLIGSVTPEQCRDLVAMARRGQMNMLRIWGGGHYEQDAFWDACDELGVLVWLDFMFACNDYPSDDEALTAEVALEAEHQVRRLRNRTALAIWAGNNEIQAIHQYAAGSLEPGNWGWSYFHELLPAAVAKHSPGAIYWPSSPFGESTEEGVNGVLDGDRHAWEVWHGLNMGAGGPETFASRGEAVHFSRYGYDHGKFISEFGIHASPERATLERWTTKGALELGSDVFVHRNKDNPKDKGFAMMEFETGLPATFDQYVDFSMACQAEGMKFGVEHYRRRQPHCSGTLVWQFNDVWPGITWSLIDHDAIGKASYYYLQRAYQPVVATFQATADDVSLWVTNSGTESQDLYLTVQIASFDGKVSHEEELLVASPGDSSASVWTLPYRPSSDHYAWVSDAAGLVAPNRQFFGPLKDLPLSQSTVGVTVERTGPTSAVVDLTSSGYSFFTHVLAPAPGVVFNSNYVDLRDGDHHQIEVTQLPTDFDVASLQVKTYDRVESHPVQG
jgi:beta-mannosidase